MANDGILSGFLREVSNMPWDEFIRAEHDDKYTSNEALIFALIRSCAMQKLDAIKTSLNRLDGKLKTPIKIEYPKIYYVFPNATLTERPPAPTIDSPDEPPAQEAVTGELLSLNIPEAEAVEGETINDLLELSLRETLTKMADYPRELPQRLVARANEVERWVRNQGPEPEQIPKVKSVVAANLLLMAQNRNGAALNEVFDQIEGKLAETLQILGEDIYITSYATVAPPGAVLNDDGVLQVEATKAQDMWAAKLGKDMTNNA